MSASSLASREPRYLELNDWRFTGPVTIEPEPHRSWRPNHAAYAEFDFELGGSGDRQKVLERCRVHVRVARDYGPWEERGLRQRFYTCHFMMDTLNHEDHPGMSAYGDAVSKAVVDFLNEEDIKSGVVHPKMPADAQSLVASWGWRSR